MDIGRRVREVREDLGMQRTVLARRVGAAENTIYRIETGKRTPSVELLEKIARELRTEPAEFLREPVPLAEAPSTGRPASYIDAAQLAPLLDEVAESVQAELRKEVQAIERTRESGQPQERYPEYYEVASQIAEEHSREALATALVVLMREDSRWGEIPELRRRIEEAHHGVAEYRRGQAAAEREERRI